MICYGKSSEGVPTWSLPRDALDARDTNVGPAVDVAGSGPDMDILDALNEQINIPDMYNTSRHISYIILVLLYYNYQNLLHFFCL